MVKEIPVYIDRAQTVIHEVIIPVPEKISAEQLEELMAASPPLNETSKNQP
ncbi:hypothetical protein [Endozoicomonas sp. ONNA2]|uniref:hypothetical protein n=1 Tax=Endozoicomonas sp. ONNA2 TaxID=2828741 RepID=UPI00214744CA|nr:hypothetical protein [Endozoicomonas sp. ONNA2]